MKLSKLQKKLRNLGTVSLIIIGLTSCTTNTNGDFCMIYEPVYADYQNDTHETIRQIDRNNVVYDDLCN